MSPIGLALVASLFGAVAEGGDVLFGGMHASRSHIASMMPLGLRLAKENLSVHFVESFSGSSFVYPPNITAHLFQIPSNPVHKKQLTSAGWRRGFGPEVIGELFAVGDAAFLDMQKLYPRKIDELLETKWDLTIVDELFGTAMYGMGAYHYERNKTPYIIHSTTTILHAFAKNLGLGRPVHHRPSMWFPYGDNLLYDVSRFRMRLRSAFHALVDTFGVDFLAQRYNIKGIDRLSVHDFDFHKAWTRSSYNFHDDLADFAFPAPISNEVKNIGRHCPTPKPLTKEFRDFMENPSSRGTIFIAFGTNVDWTFAPKHITNAFFEAINEMTDYRVIFGYNAPTTNITVGSHVKLVPWCPQVDILNHSSTRLFITHGGMKSLREAICSSTPLIVLPLAAEQTHNGASALAMGIAHVLNKFTITSKKLRSSMKQVIENDFYSKQVAKLQRIFLDRPVPALDEAAFFARADAGKILFHGMHNSRSHIGSMLPLAKSLVANGHDVHFLETTSATGAKPYKFPPGITNHFVGLPNDGTFEKKFLKGMWTIVLSPEYLAQLFVLGDQAFSETYDTHYHVIEPLLNTTWDMVVADELFSMGSYSLAMHHYEKKKTPLVVMSTTCILQPFSWLISLGRPAYSRPSMWFPYGYNRFFDVVDMWTRAKATVDESIAGLTTFHVIENYHTESLKRLGVKDFSFHKAWNRASFNFHEDTMPMAFPAAHAPDVVNIGFHCGKQKALPEEWRQFVEDPASKGTILIAFGTNVVWEYAPQAVLDSFFETMRNLTDYRIVFAFNGKTMPQDLPGHIRVVRWCPQPELLAHPKTRLFVSHGGAKSVKEAMCSATPVVFMPLFAEQSANAAAALHLGFARVVDKLHLSPRRLSAVVHEILDEPRYAERAGKVSAMYRDRIVDASWEGAFWVGRTIKYGTERKPTFRRVGAELRWTDTLFVPYVAVAILLWSALSL
ncbi:hypothetical protein QR680_017832 [Steinernema hermaphroditum]|uniref:glucuronosyltransferase n=1 Tax=Steinernema hermaphroditum TaxID=289476 RepID=A0AA39HFZ4_9BILA|nr:hypothetical protein QR680_017832 [Steinernema hermaphroditum]